MKMTVNTTLFAAESQKIILNVMPKLPNSLLIICLEYSLDILTVSLALIVTMLLLLWLL